MRFKLKRYILYSHDPDSFIRIFFDEYMTRTVQAILKKI